MNLKKRIVELENNVMEQTREKLVVFTAKTDEEFERMKAEYLKTHPEPELFVCIRDFSDLSAEESGTK